MVLTELMETHEVLSRLPLLVCDVHGQRVKNANFDNTTSTLCAVLRDLVAEHRNTMKCEQQIYECFRNPDELMRMFFYQNVKIVEMLCATLVLRHFLHIIAALLG